MVRGIRRGVNWEDTGEMEEEGDAGKKRQGSRRMMEDENRREGLQEMEKHKETQFWQVEREGAQGSGGMKRRRDREMLGKR